MRAGNVGRLHLGTAEKLPFPDGASTACYRSTRSTISRARGPSPPCARSNGLRNGRAFVQVDSYRTPEQKELFESWVLTAEFHDYPDGWMKVFAEAGYTGDYYWTIIE